MNNLIITHPGTAHFDEFFAISLVLAVNHDVVYTIERRHPTKAELANPDIWVIDVGMTLEPDLKNFDHHQGTDILASFMLVADYLNLTATLSITPWWGFKDKFDRIGPFKIADELGIKDLLPFINPIEDWFLELFEQNPGEIYPMMRSFGQHVITGARTLASQFEFWENSEKRIVKNKTVLIGLTNDSTGVQRYGSRMDPPAEISVSYDDRGDGWRLARLNKARGVDFSKLESDEKIKFAHKTGFIAKTKQRIPLNEVIILVEKAIASRERHKMMRRLHFLIGVLVLTALCLVETQPAFAASWLPGWNFRKSHVIQFASGAGTDYQVRVTANYSSGSDSGENVYLNSNCQTNSGDIRFTASDGVTQLNYWMETEADSSQAVFWVKISAGLSTANQTIYIYYGNSTVTTTSNGDKTFLFFDDFSGDLSKWTVESASGVYPEIIPGGILECGGGPPTAPYGHTSLGSSPVYTGFANNAVTVQIPGRDQRPAYLTVATIALTDCTSPSPQQDTYAPGASEYK